jgi:hypothetical protein
MKPTFLPNEKDSDSPKENQPEKINTIPGPKISKKEVAVVWEKFTKDKEKYLSIKVNLPDGSEMWIKAFKNKFAKNPESPAYIARETVKEEQNA